MGPRKLLSPLIAVAAGLLALGSGCVTGDTTKSVVKKPDVTQPGVLPPPQQTLNASPTPGGAVVPAGGTPAAQAPAPAAAAAPAAAPALGGLALPKINLRPEKKVIATDMAVAWQNKIEYLPDPTRNGALGAGLAGQLFLYGGPKLDFALADGVLTVDLIDETPRPAGQPAATPERWQFSKEQLRNLRTSNETFGKSYVLFLPWPSYKPDITRVKISARYDPEAGYTLYTQPSTVTLTTEAQVWDGTKTNTPVVVAPGLRPRPSSGSGTVPMNGPMGNFAPPPGPPASNPANPIPLGGAPPSAVPPAGAIQPGAVPPGGAPVPVAGGALPLVPIAPTEAVVVPAAPGGVMPLAPAVPAGLQPIGMIIGR